MARARSFRSDFLTSYGPILNELTKSVAEERLASPWLVDLDVAEVYRALTATMKTLSSGIYYETVPEGTVRVSLFRRLKAILDGLMAPSDVQHRVLRVTEVSEILAFLLLSCDSHSSGRPRSRQYLDWISSYTGTALPTAESSRLIIP